jgi:hypothetical protein
LIDRVANPVKIVGRPQNVVVMPSIERLCELLNVENRGGDTVDAEDLQSPASYRAALHNALIRRSPGQYPRSWLCRRLGISEDTCRRYEKQAGVHVTPMFMELALGWHNMDKILCDEPVPGCFIEDESGKRYPPMRVIARMLLVAKRRVVFKRQLANDYRIFDAAHIVEEIPALQSAKIEKPIEPQLAPWSRLAKAILSDAILGNQYSEIESAPNHKRVDLADEIYPKSVSAKASQIDPAADRPTASNRSGPEQFDSADAIETCSDQLFETLKKMNRDAALTRKTTRAIVESYGVKLVERGVKVLEKRRNIYNPAGFLIIWLRSEKPSVQSPVQPKQNVLVQNNSSQTSSASDWIQDLKTSPYLAYLANAEDVAEA